LNLPYSENCERSIKPVLITIIMEKFLIEIRNGGDTASCLRSIQSFLSSRTHYVTSVEWGCLEGEHKAWLIIKTSNREDALRIIPAAYRQNAKITRLHKFTGREIDETMLETSRMLSTKHPLQIQFKGLNTAPLAS
jgi:hypothetical protein